MENTRTAFTIIIYLPIVLELNYMKFQTQVNVHFSSLDLYVCFILVPKITKYDLSLAWFGIIMAFLELLSFLNSLKTSLKML